MAFNGVGNYTLGPGQSTRIGVCRDTNNCNSGHNEGAQILEADPNNDGTPGNLKSSDFSKEINYREFFANGRGDTNTAYWIYWATITNIGSTTKSFTSQGGGFN